MRTGKQTVLDPVEEQVLDVRVIIFFLGGCALLLFTSPAAFSQADRTEQAREILQEGGYQKDAPNTSEQTNDDPRETSSSSTSDNEFRRQERSRSDDSWFHFPAVSIFSELLRVLMWTIIIGLVGALVCLIVYLIRTRDVDMQDGTSVDEPDDEDGDEQSMDRSGMQETLADADELAEQGRFTEAIRCMFQDAARRIERDLGVALKKSDTNHEYLKRIHEAKDVQKLCRVLVQAVDRFYYGGRPCDEAAYERCRDVWEQVQTRAG